MQSLPNYEVSASTLMRARTHLLFFQLSTAMGGPGAWHKVNVPEIGIKNQVNTEVFTQIQHATCVCQSLHIWLEQVSGASGTQNSSFRSVKCWAVQSQRQLGKGISDPRDVLKRVWQHWGPFPATPCPYWFFLQSPLSKLEWPLFPPWCPVVSTFRHYVDPEFLPETNSACKVENH